MTARNAFVVGWPIAHSRSPLIHRFWLKRHRVEGDYLAEAVPPASIADFLTGFAEKGYVGGNVTLPHKEVAFRVCEITTPVARQLGAANTLWLEGDRLHGDNTDVHGFTANLDESAPDWRRGRRALVIGAGGASRAVLKALIDAGYEAIALANRTHARALELARHFGAPVTGCDLQDLPTLIEGADIIVNATSAGLHDTGDLSVPWKRAKQGAIATDLIYVPLITPFLEEAKREGLHVVDGLGMLLHQAVPGFERWFGIRPTVDADLRAHILADLRR